MKKILIILLLIPLLVSSQISTPNWSTQGITATSNHWFGTRNNLPLIFKVNNSEIGRFTSKGLSDFNFEYLTQTEIDAITNPKLGRKVFNTTTNKEMYWNGVFWVDLTAVNVDNGLKIDPTSGSIFLGGTLQEDTFINMNEKYYQWSDNTRSFYSFPEEYYINVFSGSNLTYYAQLTNQIKLGANSNFITTAIDNIEINEQNGNVKIPNLLQDNNTPYLVAIDNDGNIKKKDNIDFATKQDVISLTTAGNSGPSTFSANNINIPNYTLAGLGGIGLTSLSATTPLTYNNTSGAFSMPQATTSTSGFISSTDFAKIGTPFNLTSTASDAFTNKTGAINRDGSITVNSGFIRANSGNYSLTMDASEPLGPRYKLGTISGGAGEFFEFGAYNSQNNFDNKARDFQIFGNSINGIMVKAGTGRVGIGTTAPPNQFSVQPTQYSTGTASQSGTVITGVGTAWTSSMVGSTFVFANGVNVIIQGVTSPTSIFVNTSQTVASQSYTIQYTGLQVTNTGTYGMGVATPLATLHVQSNTAVTQTVNADVPIFRGQRPTLSNVKFDNVFQMNLGSYDNTNASASSRLDFLLNNGTSSTIMSNIMTLQANGNVGVGTTTPTSTLVVNGRIGSKLTTVSANYTILSNDNVVYVTNGATAVTITVPTATGITGAEYTIARGTGSTGAITLSSVSTIEALNGTLATTTTLANIGVYGSKIRIKSNGTSWIRIQN